VQAPAVSLAAPARDVSFGVPPASGPRPCEWDDLSTITGFDLDQFRQLMWAIDEVKGRNDEIRRLLVSELRELAVLSSPELVQRSQRVRDVVDAASRYGVDVPPALRNFTQPHD
jgi:hypothetical protein